MHALGKASGGIFVNREAQLHSNQFLVGLVANVHDVNEV